MGQSPIARPDAHAGAETTAGLDTRARVAAAAFDLFAAQGYDGTTVDAIAERAGIARRTFFRYFRSKDDVIFPDHDTLLATVQRHLDALGEVPPVQAVCSAVRVVLRSYVADPQVSVQRYRLTRSVPPLRDREIASVQRYERAFGKYLRGRFTGVLPDAEAALHADVIAAAVVAAHNVVLREWLRAGGGFDPMPALESAFAWVMATFDHRPVPRARRDAEPGTAPEAGEDAGTDSGGQDVVVAVFRADQPIDDVVERISRSL